MEDKFVFASGVQTNASYLAVPKFKLLKAEELENAIILGPDTLHLDDVLEFSNEDIGGPINGSHISDQSVESVISTTTDVIGHRSSAKQIVLPQKGLSQAREEKDDFCLDDDFVELDWLANIVEDSCCTNENLEFDCSQNFPLNVDNMQSQEMNPAAHRSQYMTNAVSVPENSATSGSTKSLISWETSFLPGRARSKRSRSGSKIAWLLGGISSLPQDRSNETESYGDSLLSFECSDVSVDSPRCTLPTKAELLPDKKPAKAWRGRKLAQDGSEIRKCTHCMTQRTPQWRAGPAGPKTLCNACGVRYKSGRLLPEYRPALSPTFQSHVHSNSHRKVLEMRRQKQMGVTNQ